MSSGKVKCTCGWSWNKSDSSKKDMYICHECGRDNSNNMRNGGWLDSYEDGGTMQEHQENYNDASVSLPEGFVGMGNNTKGRNYSPAWGGQFQMGGSVYPVNYVPEAQMGASIPGAVGFSYARTQSPAPSNGKYAKKTMASAQDGKTFPEFKKIVAKSDEEKLRESLKERPREAVRDNTAVVNRVEKGKQKTVNPNQQVKTNYVNERRTASQIIADRNAKIKESIKAQDEDIIGNPNWREVLARETQATGDKFRLFPEEDSFFDNYLNPGVMIGNMASGLGQAPLQAQQQDSYMPYVTSIGMPLAVGALGGLGTKSTGQFVNNLVNPLAGIKNPFKSKNFKSEINTMGELPDLPEDFLVKIKKLQESSKSVDMMKQDLVDPETIRRAEALGVDPEIFAEASKNMTYSLSRDFPSSYNSNNLEININPNQVGRNEEDAIMSGVMNSHSPNFTSNEIGAHELGHFFQDRNYWKEAYPKTLNGLNRKLAQNMKGTPEGEKFLSYHPEYSTRNTAPTKVDEMLKDLEIKTGLDKKYYPQKNKNYFVNADKQYGTDVDNMIEKFPMFREYRQGMRDSGILKNKWDEITPENIKDFKKLKPENRLNSFMEFNDKNYKLLNEVSKIAPAILPIGLGLGAASQLDQKREGGVIKDNMGQWNHPGEITEIGSPYITMEGVPYDVLGISDTGDTKLMKPGKNYKFKGKKVTEYPMAKNGLRQEQKGLVNLDNLTNFTNYNTKQPGGWLDKY